MKDVNDLQAMSVYFTEDRSPDFPGLIRPGPTALTSSRATEPLPVVPSSKFARKPELESVKDLNEGGDYHPRGIVHVGPSP